MLHLNMNSCFYEIKYTLANCTNYKYIAYKLKLSESLESESHVTYSNNKKMF